MSSDSTSGSTSPPRPPFILAFNVLAATGFLSLAAVLITAACNKSIRRSSTWWSLIISWMAYSGGYLLIVGHQFGKEPRFGLCAFQAAVIYATPALTGYTHLGFVIETYLTVRALIFRKRPPPQFVVNMLVALPWGVGIANFVLSLLLVADPSHINRDTVAHMYCHVDTGVPADITGILILISLAFSLPLEAWAAWVMYKYWRAFRQAMANDGNSKISISLIVRFGIFTAVPVTGIGLTLASTTTRGVTDTLWATLLPTLPVLAAVAFGTQKDIILTWICCKRRPSSIPATPSIVEPEPTFRNPWNPPSVDASRRRDSIMHLTSIISYSSAESNTLWTDSASSQISSPVGPAGTPTGVLTRYPSPLTPTQPRQWGSLPDCMNIS